MNSPPDRMDGDRFRRLVDIVHEVLPLSPPAREERLATLCGADADLLGEARSLLSQAATSSLAAVTADLASRIARAAAATPSPGPPVPERIGPYRIAGVLGEGGMGTIYRAIQDEPIRREVALKVIRGVSATANVIARFETERQTLALMDHPNIARVFDAGTTEDGMPYFVMELVRGEPITEYCDRRSVSVTQRLELFTRVCRAVQHAHQKGIIHRDLKPANVLVSDIDDVPVPKVIDFGIAKAAEYGVDRSTLLTEQGTVLGTLEYMSPEQASFSAGAVDTRSDVYSLGVMLYELLSGGLPFDSTQLRAGTLVDAQRLLLETDPPLPSRRLATAGRTTDQIAAARSTDSGALRRVIRDDLDWVIMRTLEKERDQRYQSARDLADELDRVLRSEPVHAGPPSLRYRLGKFVRRHRVGVIAASLVVFAMLSGTIAATIGFVRATEARREAEQNAARAEAVSDFIGDMLGAVRPSEAQGETVTVMEVLEQAAARIDRNPTVLSDPEVEATIRHVIGDSYMNIGELDRALPFLERALAIRREILDPADERLATTMNRVAYTHRVKGDLRASLRVAEEILALRERTVGTMHEEYSAALANVANVFGDLQEYDTAEVLLRRALRVDEQVLAEEDGLDLASTLNNLATILADLERYDEAVELHRQSLELRRRYAGPESASVVAALINLSFALMGVGDLPAAESLAVQGRELSERIYGMSHTRTGLAWQQMGRIRERQHDYDEAERYYRMALDLFLAQTVAANPQIGSVRIALGRLMLSSDRHREGTSHLAEAWVILNAALGPDAPRTREAAQLLAEEFAARGAVDEAVRWRARG